MKIPKYHCCSLTSGERTKSKRYRAGSRKNKPRYGTRKRDRGIPSWMHKDEPHSPITGFQVTPIVREPYLCLIDEHKAVELLYSQI